MKSMIAKAFGCVVLVACLTTASCQTTAYRLERVDGELITIDSTWDKHPNPQVAAILYPYQATVDSVMNDVIGVSAVTMQSERPESLLSNLVADVLRESSAQVLQHAADVGLVNMGGLRNILPKGNVTCGNVYEILPFENSLCVVTLQGSELKKLFADIAAVGGEGISGARLTVTPERKLVGATVGGKPVYDDKQYTVATIDYLADGNDGMKTLQNKPRICPDGMTLRDLFMNYVKEQTRNGKVLTAGVEGRIKIETDKK